MTQDFVRVHGVLKAIRPHAILFAVGESVPRAAWLPRATVHPQDQLILAQKRKGDAATLRIRAWKADEVGFYVPKHADGADQDLFDDAGTCSPDAR